MHLLTRSRTGGPRRLVASASAALLTVGLLVPLGAAPAAADVPTTDPLAAAAGWLARDLAATPSPGGDQLTDAILGFAAAGSARDAAVEAFAALEERAPTYLGGDTDSTSGNAAKAILAADALDRSPVIGVTDAEAVLRDRIEPDGRVRSFGDGPQLFVQSLAILALETTADGAPSIAVDYLASFVCEDGSLSLTGTCANGEVDVTAVAVQALLATGRDADAQVSWLLTQRGTDGGYPVADPNTNSSALAAQALRAAGRTAEADDAAGFVTSRQRGCEADVAFRGSFATYPDADGNVRLATAQAPFAEAPRLDLLDASDAAAETSYLRCLTDEPCPDGTGVTIVVDFTALAPDLAPQVTCVDGPFDAEPSGYDLIEAAGFDTSYASFSFGDSLCQVDELPELSEGEPADTCFEDGYWSYWTAAPGGEWTGYEVGGGDSRPAPGTVEGWSWAPDFTASAPRFDTDLAVWPYSRGIDRACPGPYDDPFDDVAGTTHAPAIVCLADGAITVGREPGRFVPNGDVTRGQAATLLVRSYEVATGRSLPAGPDRFTDDDGSTHEANIDALAAAGVISGKTETTFEPHGTLTRAQMASLLDRFLDLLDDGAVDRSFPPATVADVFADDTSSVHAAAIDRLAVRGVVTGLPDGSYAPGADVTRGQVATFLARALDLAVEAGHGDPID